MDWANCCLLTRPFSRTQSLSMTNFAPNGLEILVRCYLLLPDWAEFSREHEAINLEIVVLVERLGIGLFGAAVVAVPPPASLPAPEGPPTTEK